MPLLVLSTAHFSKFWDDLELLVPITQAIIMIRLLLYQHSIMLNFDHIGNEYCNILCLIILDVNHVGRSEEALCPPWNQELPGKTGCSQVAP